MDAVDVELTKGGTFSLGSHGYAQAFREGKMELVHRLVMHLHRSDGLIVDHVNGDRMDNRRQNLRVVDASGSSQNVRGRGASRFRGVSRNKKGWLAKVKFQGVQYNLGTFATEEEAAQVAHLKRLELMPFYVAGRDG